MLHGRGSACAHLPPWLTSTANCCFALQPPHTQSFAGWAGTGPCDSSNAPFSWQGSVEPSTAEHSFSLLSSCSDDSRRVSAGEQHSSTDAELDRRAQSSAGQQYLGTDSLPPSASGWVVFVHRLTSAFCCCKYVRGCLACGAVFNGSGLATTTLQAQPIAAMAHTTTVAAQTSASVTLARAGRTDALCPLQAERGASQHSADDACGLGPTAPGQGAAGAGGRQQPIGAACAVK